MIMSTVSFIFWWGLLILSTMIGLLKLKTSRSSVSGIVLYFMVQEVSGTLFVTGISESLTTLLIMIKGGFAPTHLWVGKLMMMSNWSSFGWMLTIQKTPYYIIIVLLWKWSLLLVLLLGSLSALYQALFVGSVSYQVFLMMTASGNNLIVLGVYESVFMFFMLMFYLSFMYHMIPPINSSSSLNPSYELIYLLMSFPGGIPFYVKLTMLYLTFNLGGVLAVLLLSGFVMNLVVGLNMVMYVHTSTRVSGFSLFMPIFLFSLLLFLL